MCRVLTAFAVYLLEMYMLPNLAEIYIYTLLLKFVFLFDYMYIRVITFLQPHVPVS